MRHKYKVPKWLIRKVKEVGYREIEKKKKSGERSERKNYDSSLSS